MQRSLQLSLPDAAATHQLGMLLGQKLSPGTVLLLQGDLGTGKTSLVQGIGAGLGIADPIVSPTFTLVNEYLEGRIPLYHFDLYRLEPQDVEKLNLESYWEGWEVDLGLLAIEWPERLPYHPPSFLKLHLTAKAEQGRQVDFQPSDQFDWDSLGLELQKQPF